MQKISWKNLLFPIRPQTRTLKEWLQIAPPKKSVLGMDIESLIYRPCSYKRYNYELSDTKHYREGGYRYYVNDYIGVEHKIR